MHVLRGSGVSTIHRAVRFWTWNSVGFLELQRFHGNSADPKENSVAQQKAPAKPNVLRKKTPIGRLDELEEGKHPYQEKEPLPPFPDNTNPITGEIGGPRGPEPTRYGDWERKGRVTDF